MSWGDVWMTVGQASSRRSLIKWLISDNLEWRQLQHLIICFCVVGPYIFTLLWCSSDLDLDLHKQTLPVFPGDISTDPKVNFLRQSFRKLLYYTQTDRHTASKTMTKLTVPEFANSYTSTAAQWHAVDMKHTSRTHGFGSD